MSRMHDMVAYFSRIVARQVNAHYVSELTIKLAIRCRMQTRFPLLRTVHFPTKWLSFVWFSSSVIRVEGFEYSKLWCVFPLRSYIMPNLPFNLELFMYFTLLGKTFHLQEKSRRVGELEKFKFYCTEFESKITIFFISKNIIESLSWIIEQNSKSLLGM